MDVLPTKLANSTVIQDMAEESQAADRIISQLSGKPIIGTSGDEHHRLNPLNVQFQVSMTADGNGDELSIKILQTDRHHPSMVYDTIKQELASMPELSAHTPKAYNKSCDHSPESGLMTIRYELPKEGADHIIHALSENAPKVENPYSNLPSPQLEKQPTTVEAGYPQRSV
ncbi:MAG: hypothetical protein R3D71_09435 [Rickettsiales bacterium]